MYNLRRITTITFKMQKTTTTIILCVSLFSFGLFTPSLAQSIAGGDSLSLFICSDGTVQGSGISLWGLGNGSSGSSTSPITLPVVSDITAISTYNGHSLFLKNDGTVWGTGANLVGQLGNGTLQNTSSPILLSNLTNIVGVACGHASSVFLKADGTVWTTGYNYFGELGDGTTVNKSTPVQVLGLTGITAIEAGFDHVLFLKNDGTVWSVGRNNFGQLGDGTQINRSIPIQIPSLSGITAIAAGGMFSLFLKNDGTVWAVGENSYGNLGDGLQSTFKITPGQVQNISGVTAIATGTHHSLFLLSDGTVWGVGYNSAGTLGDGTSANNRTLPVRSIGVDQIVSVAAGAFHSIFLKADGSIWTCGENGAGQLGDGSIIDKSIASQISSCSALSTAENVAADTIVIYPNPVTDYLTIESSSIASDDFHIAIMNLLGQEVFVGILSMSSNTATFKPGLSKGVYCVKIYSHHKQISVKKIIVE